MNEYKITYSGESEGYRLVVDRTEAAAKKYFREQAKELDLGRITIDDVELVSDHAMATKRNERETLEIIRQLVADLGEQSYLATAFQGCFEDAEQNIEFDWGCSQKRLADAAAEKVTELEAKVKELEEKLRQEIAEKQQARDEAQEVIKKLEAKALSDEDLEAVASILEGRAEEAEELAEKAAAEIVRFAEAPALPEFTAAVSQHRNHTAHAKHCRELLGKVDAIRANNHAGA